MQNFKVSTIDGINGRDSRYGREDALRQGYRNGHRERQLTGTFGTERVSVPRARIVEEDGRASEWRSRALPRYQRLTRKAEATLLCVAPGCDSRATDRSLYSGENRRLVCFVISSLQVGIQFTAWSGIREQCRTAQPSTARCSPRRTGSPP